MIGWIYCTVAFILRIFYRIFFRIEITGKERLKEYTRLWKSGEESYIIAANHIHWVDPIMIVAQLLPLKIHYMAKREIFAGPVVSFFVKMVGAFPVDRSGADITALKTAFKILKEGGNVGIFPEGTRNLDWDPKPIKGGVAMIAHRTSRPIIPVSIYSKYKVFKKIQIVVHEKMIVGEGFEGKPSADDYDRWANEIMEPIYKEGQNFKKNN